MMVGVVHLYAKISKLFLREPQVPSFSKSIGMHP